MTFFWGGVCLCPTDPLDPLECVLGGHLLENVPRGGVSPNFKSQRGVRPPRTPLRTSMFFRIGQNFLSGQKAFCPGRWMEHKMVFQSFMKISFVLCVFHKQKNFICFLNVLPKSNWIVKLDNFVRKKGLFTVLSKSNYLAANF